MEGLGGSAAGQIEQLMDLLRTTILIMQEKEVGRQRERERDRERMEEWMQEVGSELVTNHERMMADMLKKFRGVEAEWKETEQTTVRHRGMGTLLMGTILRFASVPLRKMGTDLLGSWWPCQSVFCLP